MFVLLQHDPPGGPQATGLPAAHWDFLIEIAGQDHLAAWRLLNDPRTGAAEIPAERLPDHRRRYLDYEGEISGGRGSVRRIDRGPATVEHFDARTLVAVLAGSILRGRFEITPRQDIGDALVWRRATV